MLGKMLMHGLLAAALIGATAAVYAQAKDNGYLQPDAVAQQAGTGEDAQVATGGEPREGIAAKLQRDGWLDGGHDRKHSDHHRDRRHHDGEGDA